MSPLLTVADALARAARHPRAIPWTLRFHFGFAQTSPQRVYHLLAPPAAARAVLARLHNGILTLAPAGARLEVALPEERLEPWLGELRSFHDVPIVVNEGPLPIPVRPRDPIPAVRRPTAPPQPGGLAVGLDIGGTGMKACAMRDGAVLRTGQAATWPDGERGLDSLVRRARALVIEVTEGRLPDSLGVGFASPMGVDGHVVSLSTVMRQRLGEGARVDDFPGLVAEGIVKGPVSFYNDLANLGRELSARGARRLLRLQIGTSFGGCWIDADGTVNPGELGRLVVDVSEGARDHTYLPLRGAMKSYLSNYGIAISASRLIHREVTPQEVGFLWRDMLEHGDTRGRDLVDWTAALLVGVVSEATALLPGLTGVEVGGSMLQGSAGRLLQAVVRGDLPSNQGAPRFTLSRDPGYDGARAAAMAPLRASPLRGHRRRDATGA
jgi:predicted NBD/HSP70 family sugar kinase